MGREERVKEIGRLMGGGTTTDDAPARPGRVLFLKVRSSPNAAVSRRRRERKEEGMITAF